MRKCIPLLFLCLTVLSGCWDYKDLNRLSVVSGMAFDPDGDGGVRVTLEVVDRSSQMKKEGLRSRTITTNGEDIDKALQQAQRQLDYDLYFGNMGVALISSGIDIEPLLDWMHRNREIRETVYLAAAADAGAVMQAEDGGITGYALRDILDASKNEKPVELFRVKDYLPFFKLTDGDEKTESSGGEGETSDKQRRPILSGRVLIRKGV